MKETKQIMNSNFAKCRECAFFPNISPDKFPYYLDEHGVKHRDINYICQYDLHEINSNNIQCPRCNNEC